MSTNVYVRWACLCVGVLSMCDYAYVCVCVYGVSMHTRNIHLCVYIHTCLGVHVRTYIHSVIMHVYLFVCIHIYMFRCTRTYIHAHIDFSPIFRQLCIDKIYTHAHTYIHAYIHTYIHTYIQRSQSDPQAPVIEYYKGIIIDSFLKFALFNDGKQIPPTAEATEMLMAALGQVTTVVDTMSRSQLLDLFAVLNNIANMPLENPPTLPTLRYYRCMYVYMYVCIIGVRMCVLLVYVCV